MLTTRHGHRQALTSCSRASLSVASASSTAPCTSCLFKSLHTQSVRVTERGTTHADDLQQHGFSFDLVVTQQVRQNAPVLGQSPEVAGIDDVHNAIHLEMRK